MAPMAQPIKVQQQAQPKENMTATTDRDLQERVKAIRQLAYEAWMIDGEPHKKGCLLQILRTCNPNIPLDRINLHPNPIV